jgi:hypothetical protein
MKISFQICLGIDYVESKPSVVERIALDGNYRAHAEDHVELKEVLGACADSSDGVIVSSLISFDDDDVGDFNCFALRSKRLVALTDTAWDWNFEALGDQRPENKGSWAPISRPHGLVYASRRKSIFDIAHIMDACPELVVSTEMFELIKQVDGDTESVALRRGKRDATAANGVALLSGDKFSPPLVRSSSVDKFKGLALTDPTPDFPDANLSDLGVPILPRFEGDERAQLVRSAEPWSSCLIPGWIATSAAAKHLANISQSIILNPIIPEDSTLHRAHDDLWKFIRQLVNGYPGAMWAHPWHIQDFSSRLRRES